MGGNTTNSEYVASNFNRFFTSIASKLVSKLPASRFSPSKVDSFYEANGIRKESFTLNVVAEEEIEKLLKSLNVHKSTGCDSIFARFLKDGSIVIACPVTYIFNR